MFCISTQDTIWMTAEWVGCLFFPSRPRPRRIIPWTLGPLDQNQTVAGPLKVDWMWPTLAEHALFTKVQPRPPLSGPKTRPIPQYRTPLFACQPLLHTAHCTLYKLQSVASRTHKGQITEVPWCLQSPFLSLPISIWIALLRSILL